MHSRLSRVLLSCRCLYGPLEAAQSWAFARAVLQRSSTRAPSASQRCHPAHQSFDEETRTHAIGAATELGSMHRQ